MTTATFFCVTVGSTEPIYRQLVAQVRRLIAGGHLKSDDKMPSVHDLAQFLAINPMPVSKGFGVLEAEV
jgi:GntR family transcriptional regulator